MSLSPDAHRAHVTSDPSREGMARLQAALGVDRLTVIERLGGGAASATHLLDAETTGVSRRLVLKRMSPGDEDAVEHEWHGLRHAVAVPFATPEPVAFDRDGAWFGVPALVMGALDGVMEAGHDDQGIWLRELAHALAAIHTVRVDDTAPAALRIVRGSTAAPANEADGERAAAMDVVARSIVQSLTSAELVFTHGDFHPGNVVWNGGRLVGIVDWSDPSLGPRECDVAACRADLAIHPGGDAADAFLAAYLEASGATLPMLPAWDVIYGRRAMRWGALWVDAFNEAGIDLTAEEIRERACAWLDRGLASSAAGPGGAESR